MSDVVFYRFQPDAMDRGTLERLFTGKKRKTLMKRLTKEIKTAVKNRTPRYYLIFGPRGVGKTHFVTLLYCDIEDQIGSALPVKLSEEEFSIYRVSDLFLRILELSKDREIDLSKFERMSDDEVVVAALEELKSTNKMIVLFMENLNQILGEQMSKQEVQKLRSIFQMENIFTVVTTAPLIFPQVSEHEEPFFNFFDIIYLKELTREELKELVMEIARIENNEVFLSKMDEYARKIDAVYVLTGGSPRMAMLLYDLMSKGNLVDVEKAFLKLLDENTPYYQDVFRLLSGGKRKVFDTLIELGKPATPKEIAEKARLEKSGDAYTQLRRLEKDGYVISRRMGKTTKYEVRERLFRLWRELRRQPFAMQKLSILVEFLELWYSIEERKEKFLEHFEHLKGALEETRARETSYWFSSLPKVYKKELILRVVKGVYEVGKVKLLDELVYGGKELKAEATKAEFMILLEKGDYEELLKKAEEMIKRDVENAGAWIVKGTALETLGRHEEALEAFSKAIELNPEHANALFLKGTALETLGKHEEALEAFSKSIELNPEDADAWFNKGRALGALGRYEGALEAFSKSIELNPEDADAWFNKGRALGAIGRYEGALEAFSKSIELNPDNASAWYMKGLTLGALERDEEALEALTKAIELNPEDADVWHMKGVALGDLERDEEALEALTKAIELNPEDADVWYMKGLTLGALERDEEALEALTKAIELNPEDADAWHMKGLTLGALERDEEALEALTKAIELNPEDADAWHMKGMALIDLGRDEEALEAFSKSIELNPEDADAWHMKGMALIDLGRDEEALEAFSKSIELDPEDADVWYMKGMALGDLGRYEETLEALTKAIELNPDNAIAWHMKGMALGDLERDEEALEALTKAIELNPEDADAWHMKGMALIDLGRDEEALEAFSKSIELDPEDADVWYMKGMALGDLGRYEETLEALTKAIELNPDNAIAWLLKGRIHLTIISLQDFIIKNYGNALGNLNSALDAFDAFSTVSKDKGETKEAINEAFTTFLKKLIDTKNIEAVEMALLAIFEKKKEFKELFEPISIALEIVKSEDVRKFYNLQVERREVVADIVKKLTGSEELLPEEYKGRWKGSIHR